MDGIWMGVASNLGKVRKLIASFVEFKRIERVIIYIYISESGKE